MYNSFSSGPCVRKIPHFCGIEASLSHPFLLSRFHLVQPVQYNSHMGQLHCHLNAMRCHFCVSGITLVTDIVQVIF